MIPTNDREKILGKFLARANVVAETGCWPWQGRLMANGYGRLSNRLAHRVSYELLVGQIPEGLTLDHLCRNRRCVNPKHLDPVTHRVNILRGTGASARHARKTHCPYGHPFSGENLRIERSGQRACRTCCRLRGAAKRRRLREALTGQKAERERA